MKFRIIFESASYTGHKDYLDQLINEYHALKEETTPFCKSYLINRIASEVVDIMRITPDTVKILDINESSIHMEVTL